MNAMIKNLLNNGAARKILAAAVLVGTFAALPSAPALADRGKWDRDDEKRDDSGHDRRDDRHDDRRRDHGDVRVDFGFGPRIEEREEIHVGKVYVEPVYRTVCDKVWVEPVYKTVRDKIEVPAVTKTISERVLVPDRFEERDVVGIDFRGRRCTIRQRVLVERAHYERVERTIEVVPARTDTVERRVLVSEGHWEVKRERVIVEERRHDDGFLLNLDFGK